MDIQDLRNYIEQQKGRKAQIMESIDRIRQQIKIRKRDRRRHEEAREIIRIVGLQTQKQLQYHISDITSLALGAVYADPYEMIVRFVQRRNKTECDLLFSRDGMEIDPLEASGGGVVNIASFALRVASWSMQHPKSNNVLILDEPLNNLSTDLLPRASEMIKRISNDLKLQIIMITQSDQLVTSADKIFHSTIHKGISHVEER